MKYTFHYQAIDASGQIINGRLEASGADEVASQLLKVGLTPKLIEMAEAFAVSSERLRISRSDFGVLTDHVSDLVSAQLPLSAGLRAIAEEHASGHLREAILRLANEIDRGKSLVEALRSIDAPSDFELLFNTGIEPQKIDQLLQSYLVQTKAMRDLHRSILGALLYPAILIGLGLSVILALLIGLAPAFIKIFNDFGTELPGLTMLFINMSTLLNDDWIVILFGIVLFAIAAWTIPKRLIPAPLGNQILYRIPIIGPMFQWSALSRLCHRLALLIENRIPMPDALQAAGDATCSSYYSEVTRNLAIAVISGKDLAQSAKAMRSFPPSLSQALGWSAPQSTMAESLRAMGDMYEARSRMQATWMIAIIEPVAITFTAVTVGMFVLAMFMPLIKLLNDLS